MSAASFQERAWFKSRFSNGGADDCVEVNYSLVPESAWYKSRYCNGGQDCCVEVNHSLAGHVGVRDSKLGAASPVLAIPAAQWARVITAVQHGGLDA